MQNPAKKTILIAEDSDVLIKAYKIEFDDASYNVLIAKDGEKVVKLAKSKAPDAIIIDVYLPKKNGAEILDELKKDDKLRQIPVIVASNCELEEGKKLLKKGAVDFIMKANYSPSEISARIQSHLN